MNSVCVQFASVYIVKALCRIHFPCKISLVFVMWCDCSYATAIGRRFGDICHKWLNSKNTAIFSLIYNILTKCVFLFCRIFQTAFGALRLPFFLRVLSILYLFHHSQIRSYSNICAFAWEFRSKSNVFALISHSSPAGWSFRWQNGVWLRYFVNFTKCIVFTHIQKRVRKKSTLFQNVNFECVISFWNM